MRIFTLICGLLILLAASTATAQVDPDPDLIGMYFDTEGNHVCMDFIGGPVTVYLTITSPTVAAGVSGWECHVDYTIPEDYYEMEWDLMGDAINVSTPPDFVVGLGSPLPYQSAIVLATHGILVFGPACMVWDVRAADVATIPGMPAYAAGDDPGNIIPLTPLCENYPEAALNCPEFCNEYFELCTFVVNEESVTWGELKSLYK